MPKNISYDVVLTKNLSPKGLKIEQIELVLDVTGAEPDPLTLQQIRDESTLRDCFLARRKNINDLIEKTSAEIQKAKSEKDAEDLLSAFNKKMQGEVKTLQTEMQSRADTFVQRQKQKVNDLFWARAKMVVRVGYAAAKLVKGAIEIPAKVSAAVASAGLLTVVAIKGVLSSVNDAASAYKEYADARESEREQFKKLSDAVKELKKLKAPTPVPQSKIDAVSTAVGPYGARLLGEDAAAKKLATELDKVLTSLDKGKFRNRQAQAQAEKAVESLITRIQETSKHIAEGRKLLQSAKDKVNDAGKRAQKDPTSFWDIAGAFWKAFDYLVDGAESAAKGSDLKDAFNQCVETLRDKLQEELQDAELEKATSA